MWIAALIAALALGVVAGLALIHVIGSFGIWVVIHRSQGVIPPVATPPELRRFFRDVFREWLWTTFFLCLRVPGVLSLPIRRKACRAGQTPIVLVHGYSQSWTNFVFLSPRLGRAGLGPRYSVNVRPIFGPMESLADHLSAAIDRVLAATGAEQVDVVAHSMGGLLAREIDQRDARAARRRLRRIITLGSPHRGSVMSFLALGDNARAMVPDSPFLRALAVPAEHRLIAIRGLRDNLVIPNDLGCIGQGGIDLVVEGVGHFGLLGNRRVAALVASALRGEVSVASAAGASGGGQVAVAEDASSMRAEPHRAG